MDAAKLNSLEIIFKHKEYFDQKLIDTIEHLRKTNEKMENRIILKNTTVQSLKHKNPPLHMKGKNKRSYSMI